MKLKIRIIPNASKDEIVELSDSGGMKIKIQSPPVDGAANKRLIKFLAKKAGLAKSKVTILKGEKSRVKLVELVGDDQIILGNLRGNHG